MIWMWVGLGITIWVATGVWAVWRVEKRFHLQSHEVTWGDLAGCIILGSFSGPIPPLVVILGDLEIWQKPIRKKR